MDENKQVTERLEEEPRKKNKKAKEKKSVGQEILSWVLTIVVAVIAALVIRSVIFEPVRVDGESMDDTLANGEIMLVSKYDYSTTWLSLPWQDNAAKENAPRLTIGGNPNRFDVVICRYPGRGDTNFVKRVVGLPGDTVELVDGYLYVNGEKYDEPYINDDYRSGRLNSFSSYRIPQKGDSFVIEDGTIKINGENWYWSNARLSATADNGDKVRYYYDSVKKKQVLELNGKAVGSDEEMAAVTGKEFKLDNDFFFVMGDHRNNSNDSRSVGPVDRSMIVGHVRRVVYPFSQWRGVQNGLDVK